MVDMGVRVRGRGRASAVGPGFPGYTWRPLLGATDNGGWTGMTQRMRKPSILLVEDDGSQRREVSRELAERGLQTVAVDDPASAMELLMGGPTGFSLLVTELDVLPIGGLSFARAVHRRWPALPVAIVSGAASGARVIAPGVTLLGRPLVPGQLAEAIARMVAGRPTEMLAVLSESGWSFKPLRMHG